jgi:hypothetical protein
LREVAAGFACDCLGQTKIQHLHDAVRRDLDVRGLQIAVDDAAFVRRIKRVGYLFRDPECVADRQASRSRRRASANGGAVPCGSLRPGA